MYKIRIEVTEIVIGIENIKMQKEFKK